MSGTERCASCGDTIDGQPLYPSRDIQKGPNGLEYVDEPDGPFCGRDCRRDFDGE